MSLKASTSQFTDFQTAVLSRMVDRDGTKRFVRDAMTYKDWEERAGDDKEVKMNMRFHNKFEHAPVVQFNTQSFTPDPNEITKKSMSMQSRSDEKGKKVSNPGSPSNSAALVIKDSVLNGVFTALNYDRDTLNKYR